MQFQHFSIKTFSLLLALFFIAASVVAASVYMWYDKDKTVHLTNVKPDWWTDDMDMKSPEEIHPPEGPTPFPGIFVGDKENRKFHRPSCDQIYTPEKKMAIPDSKIIWFQSYEEAISKGYHPCKHCKPLPVDSSESNH